MDIPEYSSGFGSIVLKSPKEAYRERDGKIEQLHICSGTEKRGPWYEWIEVAAANSIPLPSPPDSIPVIKFEKQE